MISLLPVLVSIWATLVFLVGCVLLSRHVRRGSKLPPGNKGWPLIGEFFSLLKPYPTTARAEFMEHRLSRFGKIFSSNLLGNQAVISVDAEMNRFILKKDISMFEPGWPGPLTKLFGQMALILLVGDAHKNLRSIYLDFLSSERLRTVFLPGAQRTASWLLGSWINGSVISAKDEANKFSFYLLLKELISTAPGDTKLENIRKEYKEFDKGLSSIPLYVPGTTYWKAFQSKANVINFFKHKREERTRMKSNGNGVEENGDFLSWSMKNTNYSTAQIDNLLFQVLFSGHDMVAKAIFLMVYFLEGNPKVVEKLREEHRQILRLKPPSGERTLTWDDYKVMEFTQCVINETLRMGCVAPYLYQKASADFQFKGYVIPRGCTVIAHISAVHLDPALFEDPQHFNPWRWLGPTGLKKPNEFMPFGGGARLCPGRYLARLEMAVFLHHLILKYDWELVEPDHPMSFPLPDFPKGLWIKVQALSNE